jgi:hypothetical protein
MVRHRVVLGVSGVGLLALLALAGQRVWFPARPSYTGSTMAVAAGGQRLSKLFDGVAPNPHNSLKRLLENDDSSTRRAPARRNGLMMCSC